MASTDMSNDGEAGERGKGRLETADTPADRRRRRTAQRRSLTLSAETAPNNTIDRPVDLLPRNLR